MTLESPQRLPRQPAETLPNMSSLRYYGRIRQQAFQAPAQGRDERKEKHMWTPAHERLRDIMNADAVARESIPSPKPLLEAASFVAGKLPVRVNLNDRVQGIDTLAHAWLMSGLAAL